jgi:shikimate dehydrogenase
MRHFGLIGFPLSHSFSKKYFTEKFSNEGINDCSYELYPIEKAADFVDIFKNDAAMVGLNVTIPHKQAVIPFLNSLDPQSAGKIGAVNVIKKEKDGSLTGYNSDYYGFKLSLQSFLDENHGVSKALILGKGGAALAVQTALEDMGIAHTYVSRTQQDGCFTYEQLGSSHLSEYKLIINASPIGTYPNVELAPAIPYEYVTENHFLYDLVYNPETTQFMQEGLKKKAKVINGLQMLKLQAEKAWEIWNKC